MNVQKRNDVTIYNLSSGPQLPEWLGERARRNLSKRDPNVMRRIELLQDFQMPSSSSKVVQSLDGRYVIVGGTYPPRIRCYDVHDLTMKFERYVNAHIVDIVMLGEDYGKMAILQDDRTIAFHAHYGSHESIRVPKFGRGMAYEPTTCELLVAASGSDIYRLNLEEGRFTEPWSIESSTVSASCIAVSQAQPLASVGCDDGIVRFWDNRTPDSLLKPVLKLDVQAATVGYGFADELHLKHQSPHEITSLAHDLSGLYMGVGTAGGLVALYDVRSSKPLHIKEHKHGMSIHTLKFHPGSGCLLSSDEKLVKIWKYKSTGDLVNTTSSLTDRFQNSGGDGSVGSVVANVEGNGKFTNFIMAGDEKDPTGNSSGLMLCATDQPKLEAYYIPKVGIAPSWCSFLENITEELEERDLKRETNASGDLLVRDGQETVFENYKFVSRDDLEKLGVSDLIGTPLLKAYMHGFFMDINLYNKIRAVANPFEYEEYRKKKVKERLEAKRASRIAPKASSTKKSTLVNPDLADRLQNKAEANTKAGKVAKGILSDDRFGNLFTDPAFQIDEEDENFKLRNPSGVAAAATKRKRHDDMDSDDDDDEVLSDNDDAPDSDKEVAGFHRVDDEDEDEDEDEESDSDDEDGFRGGKVRGEAYEEVKALKRKKVKSKTQKEKPKKSKKAVMYEADDLGGANTAALHASLGEDSASTKVKDKIRRMNMPLEKRFQMQEEEEPYVKVTQKGGSKEITYVPKDSRKKLEKNSKNTPDEGSHPRGQSNRNRRGIKDLGFRTPFKDR
jgi:ribosome biogenesis protein ENP2